MARGSTRQWRTLRARVIQQEPYCQLQFIGCTDTSTTADHINPVATHPHLEYDRTNLQGACRNCNRLKSDLTLDEAIRRYGRDAGDDEPAALNFFR